MLLDFILMLSITIFICCASLFGCGFLFVKTCDFVWDKITDWKEYLQYRRVVKDTRWRLLNLLNEVKDLHSKYLTKNIETANDIEKVKESLEHIRKEM